MASLNNVIKEKAKKKSGFTAITIPVTQSNMMQSHSCEGYVDSLQ